MIGGVLFANFLSHSPIFGKPHPLFFDVGSERGVLSSPKNPPGSATVNNSLYCYSVEKEPLQLIIPRELKPLEKVSLISNF